LSPKADSRSGKDYARIDAFYCLSAGLCPGDTGDRSGICCAIGATGANRHWVNTS
jgi:hypothetical protein